MQQDGVVGQEPAHWARSLGTELSPSAAAAPLQLWVLLCLGGIKRKLTVHIDKSKTFTGGCHGICCECQDDSCGLPAPPDKQEDVCEQQHKPDAGHVVAHSVFKFSFAASLTC